MLRLLSFLTFDVYDREEQEKIAQAPPTDVTISVPVLVFWVLVIVAIAMAATAAL